MLLEQSKTKPILDIDFRSKDIRCSVLSNLYPSEFTYSGIKCNSIEGLLQSFKTSDTKEQQRICHLHGFHAKKAGKFLLWNGTSIFFKGHEIDRFSEDYHALLEDIYYNCFTQNVSKQLALLSVQHYEIVHSIGKQDPKHTILTEGEFLHCLNNTLQIITATF